VLHWRFRATLRFEQVPGFLRGRFGTAPYMSPEMAKGTGHSFGCSTANSAIFGYCWICFLLDMIDMIDMIEFYLILLDIIGYY